MRRTTRRGVLATMGLAAAAGCSSLSNSLPGTGSGSDVRGETITKRSESFTMGRGDFKPYPLSFDTESVLLFSVVADETVDVFTLRRPDFEAYKTGKTDQLSYIGPLSEEHTSATAKGANVTAGEPVLVVDNTTWAQTAPADEVSVEVELEAFVRAGRGGN